MAELIRLIPLLRPLRLFSGLRDGDLATVARAAQYREFDPGLCLFRQGMEADSVYVLCHGSVKLLQSKAEGPEVLLRFINAGDALGPMTAMERPRYAFTAQAVRWCQALSWNVGAMAQLMEACPRIALNALTELTARMQELQMRYRELATERVEQRLAQVLIRLAAQAGRQAGGAYLIDVPLSRRELAQMTGTTLYTVSRVLSAWERRGVVEAGRRRVAILAHQQLTAIADAGTERRSRARYRPADTDSAAAVGVRWCDQE